MILKRGTFYGMAQDIISSRSKVVIFGTGVIGSTVIPEILNEYNILDNIICCVDNDKSRWNTYIYMCGIKIPILSPDILENLDGNVTVLITISRFIGVFEQLNDMIGTENHSCYIIPAMCIENFHNDEKKGVIKSSDKQVIPKIIHYMWLGKKEIPDILKQCIDSWKRYCPDYEIIRWDESNYDVHKNEFVSQAYDNKMYGFVPDYARIELLYEYGGIYLDTDVELIRNLDDLLYQDAFCSVEKWQVLNWGGCSGAIKGHVALIPFLDRWAKRSLVRKDGTIDNLSSGMIDTSIAIEEGYKVNGKNQTVNGMNIYAYDYFHPYDYMSGKLEATDDTFSVHHFNGGWLDGKSKDENENITKLFERLMKSAIYVG